MARKLRIIKTRRRVAILIASLLIMIIATVLIAVLGQPQKATIIKSSQQDSGSLDIESGLSTLKGAYFSLEYWASLNTVTDITSQDINAIEAYRVARSAVEDRRILIVTIKHTQAGGLEEDSSYKIRKIQSETYRPSTHTFNGNTFYIMSRTDGTEVVAFVPHGDKMAVIAYTAGASDTTYQNALDAMKSFKWL